MMSDTCNKLGPLSVFALATGGMVGGGIYVALGVVVEASAQWIALSFLIAGVVAVTTAYSYAHLSNQFGKSGGAFEFLEELDHKGLAGTLSWLLLVGYVLTIALYAYAFGQYVANAFGGGAWLTKALALLSMIILTGVNLLGLGKMRQIEIVIVVANLLALLALGLFGMSHWEPGQLTQGINPKPVTASIAGAAAIFVSYEGFQLLTYEYDQVEKAKTRFLPVLTGSAIVVVLIYIGVALGSVMLIGASASIENKSVALAVAAREAWGMPGFIILTIAAGFATSAAINSTLFSSAKLARRVAQEKELPGLFAKTNSADAPWFAIIGFGLCAGILSVTGSLSQLVEAASLVFLVTFLTVNLLCMREAGSGKIIPLTGFIIGAVLGIALVWRLAQNAPVSLAVVVAFAAAAFLVRPWLLKRFRT